MKCANCGAENPDYAVYCGMCAKEVRGIQHESSEGGSSEPQLRSVSIESILSRNLLRIEENLAKKRKGPFRSISKALSRPRPLVFSSDKETVTLNMDKEGRVTLTRGRPSGSSITLSGPHSSFMTLFQDERNISTIPASVGVRLGPRDPSDEFSEQLLREIVGHMLQELFR